MNLFEKLKAKLESVSNKELIEKSIEDYGKSEQDIIDVVRVEQLYNKGENSKGGVIGYYSVFTEELNPEKVAGTPYTLNDSGRFFDSMVLVNDDDGLFIEADGKTGKDEDIIDKYGKEILGFKKDNVKKVIDIIKEPMPIVIRDIISESM